MSKSNDVHRGRPSCFVCGNEIRQDPLYIGKGLYRHSHRCAPLTKQHEEYRRRGTRVAPGRELAPYPTPRYGDPDNPLIIHEGGQA
jgi:hypothetical protein